MNNAEEWISDVEDKIMEITQSGQQTENQVKKHGSNIRDLWDNIKQANLRIIGIPEGEEKEKGIKNIFEEIMAENFPNLKKKTNKQTNKKKPDIKIQEAQRAPNRPTPRHIVIKWQKLKTDSKGSKRKAKH